MSMSSTKKKLDKSVHLKLYFCLLPAFLFQFNSVTCIKHDGLKDQDIPNTSQEVNAN